MLVIHIIPKFTKTIWGGAESMIVDLIKNYPPEVKGEVWTCKTPRDARKEIINGVTVYRFTALYPHGKHTIGIGRPGIPLGLLAKILHLRQRLEPILLHLHVHNFLSSLSLITAKLKGIETILTIHSQVSNLRPIWRYFLTNTFSIKYATRVVAVSEAVASEVRKVVGREDVKVIPIGIDRNWLEQGDRERGRRFLNIPQGAGTKILLFVGRMASVKNLEVLIEAFSILLRSVKVPCYLVIVGPEAEPDYRDLLQETALRLGVAAYVIFTGSLLHRSPQLADIYAASDLVVVPSKYEAFPLSVLESWGAKRPVVVADVGGMGSMVRKWDAGFLWTPSTGPEGLAKVLHKALEYLPTDIEEKIEKAREYYSAQRMVKDYVDLYQTIVNK